MSFSSTRCASGASLTSRASSVSCSDGIVGSARARDIAVISEDWGTRPGQEASPGLAAGILRLRPHVAFYKGHKCRADRIHQRAPGERLITIAADRERLGAQIGITDQPRRGSVAVAFEWPDGEALKVSRLIGAKNLSLKVAGSRDWFEITGTVAVDENLVLDMQDLLAQLDKARGRFVPLDGGRFLTLTEDLKRQLKHLYAVSEETAQGRLLHGLGAMAIDELVEDAGKVETDQRWRDQVAKVRSAGAHQPVVPSTLQAELRDYQHDGFVWLSRLAHLEMGACLADDMGLGKTVQAIAVLVERAWL
jgi:hypothetical protein